VLYSSFVPIFSDSNPFSSNHRLVLYPERALVELLQGTIVEWTAQVGQAVKADDVVALVETDKVTVEIKAEIEGVITQQFGAV